MGDFWDSLSATTQDALLLAALLAIPALVGLVICRGFALRPLLGGLIRRFFWTNLVFVLLVAVAVAVGIGLIAQERGLRQASARVAEKFDLIIAAPGDQTTMLMQTVFLQAGDAPLIDGPTYDRIANADRVALAAPIAFGDSWQGAPVIGSTAEFVTHLSGDLAEGQLWTTHLEAVAGARIPADIGQSFTPSHGVGHDADGAAHEGVSITITGRMQPTGSPWDKAILVPVESVWRTHGLADGHSPEQGGARIGPPFDPAYFPGTPSVIVHPEGLAAAYGLQAQFDDGNTMAFFPGAVLTRLYGILGNIRTAMSLLALISQALVAVAVIAGLIVLARLFARHIALLRAIGAPARMVFALLWSHTALLLASGGLLGLALGWGAVRLTSAAISARTDLVVTASLGWSELHLLAAFLGLASFIALLPPALALTRPIASDLRQ